MTPCKFCGGALTFDQSIRGKNGNAIPLNLDGTRHDCRNEFDRHLPDTDPQARNTLDEVVRVLNRIADALEYLARK